jgi:hypothetical protein
MMAGDREQLKRDLSDALGPSSKGGACWVSRD